MSPGRIKFKRPHLGWRYHLFNVRPYNRHSLILSVAGLCYMLTGATYISAAPTPARKAALAVALRWFPIEIWGMIFVIVGLLVVISSRWPRVSDSWGYALLTGLSAGWSATYAAGVIFEACANWQLYRGTAMGVASVLVVGCWRIGQPR
jgi:hypothetical protein